VIAKRENYTTQIGRKRPWAFTFLVNSACFQLTILSINIKGVSSARKSMNWLNNGWIVGIATSVISGLVVTWIARILLSKKEDREYKQKIAAANRDVIYAIRPGISEGQIPSQNVIVALIRATARRYEVEGGELYSAAEIMEELMKEVMDSSFLSSAKKAEYCVALAELRDESSHSRQVQVIDAVNATATVRYRIRNVEITAYVLGTLAALAGGIASVLRVKISGAQLMAFGERALLTIVVVIVSGMFLIKIITTAANDLREMLASTRKVIKRRDKDS
jgi:hypothetical protein